MTNNNLSANISKTKFVQFLIKGAKKQDIMLKYDAKQLTEVDEVMLSWHNTRCKVNLEAAY